MVDLHCHILPGLDDGPPDLATSLDMARIAQADGIRVIAATPHVDLARGVPTPDQIRERAAALNEALQREGIAVHVVVGAEYELTPELPERVQDGAILTLADRGRHMLVELPFSGYPTFVAEVFFRIQLMGVVPVLAHPERAALGRSDPAKLVEYATRGALLQVNVDSIIGREGRAVRAVAHRLLREGAVYVVASDGHDPRSRPPRLTVARKAVCRLCGDEAFTRLSEIHPGRILGAPWDSLNPRATATSAPAAGEGALPV